VHLRAQIASTNPLVSIIFDNGIGVSFPYALLPPNAIVSLAIPVGSVFVPVQALAFVARLIVVKSIN
jgi:hypothetical protein